MQTIDPASDEDVPAVAQSAVARRRDLGILIALVLVGAAVSLVRVPFAHHDIVWAEDANIFLFEAVNRGPWNVIFEGYAGYQHLIPRVSAAFILSVVPLGGYAIAVFWWISLLTGLVAAAVFWLARDVVPWMPARVALAATTFLLPLAAQEVIGNLADFHTYCMWLMPWLLFARHRTWTAAWLWGVVAFFCAMTEVQAILFLALLPFLFRRRNAKLWPTFGAMVVAAFWQLLTVLTVERDTHAAWVGVVSIVQGWLINTILPLVNPDPEWVRSTLQTSGFIIPLLLTIPFAAAIVLVLVKGTPQQRLLVVTLALVSAAVYAGGAVIDGSWWFRYSEVADGQPWERAINVRYGVASGFMLAATIPLAAAVLFRITRTGRARVAGAAVAWAAILVLTVGFAAACTQAVSVRDQVDGQWSPAVRAAVDACRGATAEQEQALPVAPGRVVIVTCGQLADFARTS